MPAEPDQPDPDLGERLTGLEARLQAVEAVLVDLLSEPRLRSATSSPENRQSFRDAFLSRVAGYPSNTEVPDTPQ